MAAAVVVAAVVRNPLAQEPIRSRRRVINSKAIIGIGRTRLAEALAADAASAGAMVLQSRCYETERSLFLQPVVEALLPAVARLPAVELRHLLGEDAPAFAALVPEAAAVLGPMPAERVAMDMQRRRAFHSVLAFLRELAARNPVLLVVDDLQYAGQSTIELVHYLGRHAGGIRLLVVATVRAENDADVGAALAAVASRVEVGPLGADAAAGGCRARLRVRQRPDPRSLVRHHS